MGRPRCFTSTKRRDRIALTAASPATPLFTCAYTYSSSGRTSSMTDSRLGTTAYAYTSRGELAGYADPLARRVSYAYDASGNRMSKRIAVDYAGPWDEGKKLGINEIVDAVMTRQPLKGNKAGIKASVIDILEHILQGTPMPSGEKAGLTKTVLEVVSGSVFQYGYSYNKADQLLSYTDPVTSCAYSLTYDSRGNLTAKEDHTGTALYAWDSRNRLVSLTLPSGERCTYAYTANNARLLKSSPQGTTRYGYEGPRLAWRATTTPGGTTVTTSFTYTPQGAPYAMRRSTSGGSESFFYHLDAHGDVLSLTDMQGHEVASYAYGPWGELQYARGPEADTNPLRYASYCYDPESGLYYLINRYYEPTLGRFLTRDPLKHADTDISQKNQYAYCGNEPVGSIDMNGTTTKNTKQLKLSNTFYWEDPIGNLIRIDEYLIYRGYAEFPESRQQKQKGRVWLSYDTSHLWQGSPIDGTSLYTVHLGMQSAVYSKTQKKWIIDPWSRIKYLSLGTHSGNGTSGKYSYSISGKNHIVYRAIWRIDSSCPCELPTNNTAIKYLYSGLVK